MKNQPVPKRQYPADKNFSFKMHLSTSSTVNEKMHFHAAYKLYIVFDRGVKTYIDKKSEIFTCSVPPNSAVLIKSYTVHRMEFDAESAGFERYVVYFTERFVEEMKPFLNGVIEKLTNTYIAFSQEEKEFMRMLSLELFEHAEDGVNENYNIAKLKLTDLLLRLGDMYNRTSLEENAQSIDEAAAAAERFIRQNYKKKITQKEVLAAVGNQSTYVLKRFKAVYGMSMVEYINRLRVKSADQLLQYSNISLEKIAEKCGFSGQSYFGEMFVKYMGMSPYKMKKIKTKQDYHHDDYV